MTAENREQALIEWLERRPRAKPTSRVEVGIGDDAACIRSTGHIWISSDMLLDGVHFDARRHLPEHIGRKALACSLSDCAAMAVRPIAAVISLALPSNWPLENVQSLYRGIDRLAAEFNCDIVGGDTTSWPHPLVIDVTILAEPRPNAAPVLRSGAKPGDTIFVTGPLGGSLIGRHLMFSPRVHEAGILSESLGPDLHAMMDISDGLALDLHRLCAASDVGATLIESRLTDIIHDDARRAATQDRRSALDHALADGEDFELLLAVAPNATTDTAMSTGLDDPKGSDGPATTLIAIGHVTHADSGVVIESPDGRKTPLPPAGFQHH